MRLLNTTTGELKEFTNAPRYAILSHRWGDDEISYDEYCAILEANTDDATPKDKRRAADIMSRASYLKIVRFCLLARERGVAWAWCDACCIDKRSSAELSEAINSMWAWYRDAAMCLVFLVDVAPVQQHDHAFQLRRSGWFRRGWTLQELLAPSMLLFYAQDWSFIDLVDKNAIAALDGVGLSAFLHTLCEITRVSWVCLCSLEQVRRASVAQKMSWASLRSTTRPEDQAYCLLGLFDVQIPLLYGEGDKAFTRLQKAILETSDDESIFAWRAIFGNRLTTRAMEAKEEYYEPLFAKGMLADDIRHFAGCGDVVRDLGTRHHRLPYSVTNKGLDMTAEVTLVKIDDSDECTRMNIVPCLTYVLFLLGLAGERCAIALRCLQIDGPSGSLIAVGRCYAEPNSIEEILRGHTKTMLGMARDDETSSALWASMGKPSTRRLFIRL